MGYLLKEALKTLCGVNQWAYAVFWKIGCQNPKLLIWEECYYEPLVWPDPSKTTGLGVHEVSFWEWDKCFATPEVQARGRIQLLIDRMMANNEICIVGEGIIGRAAFSRNHQWILSKEFNRDAHPPEALNDMHYQFSAGIETVAVIPVSPHGVVQFGSPFSIMENVGFVNDVRSLILQLACIPNALFSDDYAANFGVPVSLGMPCTSPSETCIPVGPIVSGQANQLSAPVVKDHNGPTPSKTSLPEVSPFTSSSKNIGEELEGVPLFNMKRHTISRSSHLSGVEILKNEDGHMLTRGSPSQRGHHSEKHDAGSQNTVTNIKYEETSSKQHSSGDDLFDVLGVELKNKILSGCFHSSGEKGKEVLISMNTQEDFSGFYGVHKDLCDGGGIFSELRGDDHLLDAVVSRAHSFSKQSSEENFSCRTTLTNIRSSSVLCNSPSFHGIDVSPEHNKVDMFGIPNPIEKISNPISPPIDSGSKKDGNCSQATSFYSSHISSWVEQSHGVKIENSVSTGYSKKADGITKPNRKRLKPGENPRPRPKDRQMIQDRVKELREIVPNGAKCSIDALLERTIKHMVFLQSVTKYADSLKESGESKILNKKGGLLVKDNFEGGATWAFEVGSQSMICPIIVEDLNPPRQMLVEMLCEDQGLFLEIADMIRGLGLTILKGVMEARNDKIWARFAVEANRDVTRMEIFMSLVRLLDQTAKSSEPNPVGSLHTFTQPATIPATCGPQ